MRCRHRALAFLAVATLVAVSRDSLAQGPAKPAPEHAVLQSLVGVWDATAKTADGQETKGTATYKSQCDGLWIGSDFNMEFGGEKFEGHGQDGYDTNKKKYVSVWVDSMSTSPLFQEGDFDKATKTLTMTGSSKTPDGQSMKVKSVTVMTDKDHHTLKMFVVAPDGTENLMMTVEYKRKQ